MLKRSIIIFILSFTSMAVAQHYRGFQVNLLPGFLIAHRDNMANMEAHTLGIEVVYSSNFTGWKQTDESFPNLRWGSGLSFFSLGNRELNGNVYAWHLHAEACLSSRKHFSSLLRIGSGIGYIDRPYNLISNRMNKAIGSGLNGNMQLMYKALFDLSPQNTLVLGAGITHYSNGNFRRPNLGINMAHLNLGLLRKVCLTSSPPARILPELYPRNGFELSAGYARKQIAVADTRFFNIYSTSLLYYRSYRPMRAWRMGTEVFFDRTYPYTLFNESSLKGVRPADMTEIAVKAGHEFHFGRISVVTDLGTYLYRPNDYKKSVYFSIGFNYHLNRGWNAQTRLKSHMAVADYFYWSGAYRFSDRFLRKKP